MASGKFNSLPSWFLATRSGQEAVREAEEAVRTDRRSIAKAIRETEEERDRLLAPLKRESEKLRAKADRAMRLATAAKEEAHRASAELTARQVEYAQDLERWRGRLRELASPAIDEAISKCLDILRDTRATRIEIAERRELVDGELRGPKLYFSTRAEITRRCEAANAAIKALEALKEDPEHTDLEIERIMATIPPLEGRLELDPPDQRGIGADRPNPFDDPPEPAKPNRYAMTGDLPGTARPSRP